MDDTPTPDPFDRRRAARPYRVLEALGLVLLLFGLAASAWGTALAGAAVILVSYGLYRRRHGATSGPDPGSAGMGDEGGGD